MNKTEFNKLTPEQQAVLIAKDVIAQLKTKTYKSKPGVYIGIEPKQLYGQASKELCSLIDGLKGCEVCARGALFLSHIKFANRYKVEDLTSDYYTGKYTVYEPSIKARLNKSFGAAQQAMIETAYEKVAMGISMEFDKSIVPAVTKACIRFGRKYRNSTDRLIAIMRNIIRNKGKFIPNG